MFGKIIYSPLCIYAAEMGQGTHILQGRYFAIGKNGLWRREQRP